MDIKNKSRIYWACRRGMRELDLLIMPFFQHDFDFLSKNDQKIFLRLLQSNDPDLLNWLMHYEVPEDTDLQRIVSIIQQRNQTREFVIG
ncbi:FAD assembly factor SdhE [Candidatus Erwinia haradaeae]|uniref:FAD assembly factor SdhE n=1 Tax=Candidatus Erwinia haradaeae TaxID=1922217 RepID=A0A451D8D1_9GAMM|nr:FAD assembly factor SdhE [Candidatus Erwinia haradaeae]VFP82100.1 FAD assembly factor SdhE [Candidatus Erwinia haradaeae]